MRILISFLAFLTFLSSVSAFVLPRSYNATGEKRMTNAERFRRGLGPNAPVFKRVLPGSGEKPTGVIAAKRSKTSSLPVTYTGRIEVRNLEGHSFGYVWNSESGVSGVNFHGPVDELHVKISTTKSGGLFDILATNPKFPPPFYIGASSNNAAATLGPGLPAGVGLGTVEQTPPGPSAAQSAIWTINRATKLLTPHWVNPDGSKPTTSIGLDLRNNYLTFTGDIAAYNAANTWPVGEVQFFLVDF
ncbi:unnamed protein product [Somion occarium]|uniref:Uncharacterized protein n=1 Tax=Somion occarium TaxID=3059160 RepID=A0ABP1E764_9APHY